MMQGRNSQRMRPAVSTTPSSENDVKQKLAEAKELEAELKLPTSSTSSSSKSKNNNDQQEVKTRQLFEIFGHIIIEYPKEARENKCVPRLFNGCIYPRVTYYRRQIMKAQKKQRENENSNNNNDNHCGGELKKIDERFKGELNQFIRSFDHIRGQYVKRLADAAAASAGTGNSNRESLSSTKRNKKNKKMKTGLGGGGAAAGDHPEGSGASTSTTGSQQDQGQRLKDQEILHDVVANLHMIYMYLGDLERYKNANGEAEKKYLLARAIAPGFGQVYNQLGSVSFNIHRHMEAFYFYARCMSVTHVPFTKAQVMKNVQLVERKNLSAIEESERNNGIPFVLKDGLHKNDLNLQRKGAAMSFTRFFLKLMFDMLNEIKKRSQESADEVVKLREPKKPIASFAAVLTGKDDTDRSQDSLRGQMDALLTSMRSVVKYSIFAEAVVIKMIIILLFVGHSAFTNGHPMIGDMVQQMLLSVGSSISEYTTKKALKNRIDAASASKPPPYVKSLVLFEIILESLLVLASTKYQYRSNDTNSNSSDVQASSEKSSREVEESFWKEAVEIGNLTTELIKKYDIPEQPDGCDDDDDDEKNSRSTAMKIREYRDLKGFNLFPEVNTGYESTSEMYIPPDAAIEALETEFAAIVGGESQETKATGSTSAGSSAGPEEQKAKLYRMVEICQKLCSDASIPIDVCHDGTSAFVYRAQVVVEGCDETAAQESIALDAYDSLDKSEVSDGTNGDKDNDNDPTANAFDGMDDEAGDAVVYKPQQGGGPALLTPAGIFAGNVDEMYEVNVDQDERAHERGMVNVDYYSKGNNENGLPLPAILPPPGFGAAPLPPQPPVIPLHSDRDPLTAPIIGQLVGVHNDYMPPTSQLYDQSPLYPDTSFLSQHSAAPPPGQLVATGIDLYVDDPSKVRSANPFLPRDYQLQMGTTLSYQSNVQQERDNFGEGEGFLPADLLTANFWSDETQVSKNPWAK